jgi:two-component system, cell cycle sensor histidine kinase and response regulator CckA
MAKSEQETEARVAVAVSPTLDETRVREHIAVAPVSAVGHIVVAAGVAWVDYTASSSFQVISWLAPLLPVCLYRLWLVQQFRRAPHRLGVAEWLRHLRGTVVALGVVWGLAALALLPQANLAMQVFWLGTLGGLAAAATVLTTFDLTTGVLFVVFTTVPTTLRLLTARSTLVVPMALLLAWSVLYAALHARRTHARVVESNVRQDQASGQADRLREANEQLEREVAERTRALKASEERLAFAVQNSNQGLWDWEIGAGTVLYSATWARLLGYAPSDFTAGADLFWDHVHPDDAPRAKAERQAHLEGRRPSEDMELRLRTKSGDYRWFLNRGRVVERAPDGRPWRAVGTIEDITERRQLQAHALQTQKMEVVGHLAGGIAHDFNNALTVITTNAELAMSESGAALEESLTAIRDASARASSLTAKLLAFSRQQILQPSVFSVNELIEGLTPMLSRLLGARVALETRLSPTPVMVKADRGSLEQVVLNLAINSSDAMPQGGSLRIAVDRVSLERAPDGLVLAPGPYACVTVTDTGEGMSADTLARIFEPFFTTKGVGRGTGLGLSAVHGIVAQSGGGVTAESALNAGTTLRVYLPSVERAVDVAPVVRRLAMGGTETILVVDDDPDVRGVVQRVLSPVGYGVRSVSSGDEALALLQGDNTQIDMLITDVVMPGLSGQELARRVIGAYPRVRILLSSGYAEHAVAHHDALPTGVHFIGKPYTPRELRQKVRDVLDAPR